MPASLSYKPLAKRSAQLLLSPYCWSAKKLCEFLRDCWDLVKDDKGQDLKPEIQNFRNELNARALECELWAPFEHWTDFIPDDEFNAIMRRAKGTPKPKTDKVDRLLQLIRNKVNHPENDSEQLTTLNWEPKDAGRIDWNRFADYWTSKFVMLAPFVWSQFICMKTSLTKYYPSDLLDLKTDWRKILFSPEEFVNELHAEFQKHLNSGFVDDRFKIATGKSTHTIELRTLPGEEEDLLNAVLSGDLFKKIVISASTITSCNRKEIFSYKTGGELEKKKWVTYIFLSLDYKLNGKFYGDLFDGSNEKIVIFTGESAIQSLTSKIKEYENVKNLPFSWRDLSMQKRKSLQKNGRFEIQGKIFGISEIVPGQEQEMLSLLEGKELKAFIKNQSLPILQKYRLPEVDRFYQEREIYDSTILSWDFFKNERNISKNDVYILVYDNPKVNLVSPLPKRKIFPKLKLRKKSDKLYYVESKIQKVINDIRNFEGCEDGMEKNVHFFEVISVPNCVRWIATHGSSDIVKRHINQNSKLRMPESYFLYMVDDGFVRNGTIFIANQGGMGKTQFLLNFANKMANERKNIIPLYIFMSDFVEVLRAHLRECLDPTCDDIISALSSYLCLSKFESSFFCRLLKCWKENTAQKGPKIIIIFDGMDEVKSKMKELALKTLEILHKKFPELRMIAAVREDAFDKIKGSFGTLGCMLAPIEHPEKFIESYWRECFEAKVFSRKIKENENFKRTFHSRSVPDLLIPENNFFDIVSSQISKPGLVVIYEDLHIGISPLLLNAEKDFKENKKAKVYMLSVKMLADSLENENTTFLLRRKMKEINFLLIDANLCEPKDSGLVRSSMQSLLQMFELSGTVVWLCLKSSVISDMKIFDINTFEFEALPSSNIEKALYLESFWRENLASETETYLSRMIKRLALACLEAGFGLNKKLAGIPLQCRMVAEILEEGIYRLDWTLPEMSHMSCQHYKTLLSRKYENWFQKKYANVPLDSLLFKAFRHQFNRFLQFIALQQMSSELIANKFRNELLIPQNLEKCEELYDAAIAQSILQSKDPLRFTHRSFAEYFVGDFLYKRLKHDLLREFSFRGKLKSMEITDEKLGEAITRHIKNLKSVYSEITVEQVGILEVLNNRLHPFLDSRKYSIGGIPILETYIPRVKDRRRSPVSLYGSTIPASVSLLCAVYQYGLFVAQLILFHSPDHIFGYFAVALIVSDFKMADNLLNLVALELKYAGATTRLCENQCALLYWMIIGMCWAERESNLSIFSKMKGKILEYSTDHSDIRKDLITHRNSEGQTPLLFLMNCMNWYRAPFDTKMYEFFVKEFDADLDAVDSEGNSVLHFTFYSGEHEKMLELVGNFFTEVFPNVIKFFLPRVKAKHSMNKLGFTPAVNFMLSLDQTRNMGIFSRNDVKNCVKCIKLFDYKKDFYERDEAGNTSINKLIEYLCHKYKGTGCTETTIDDKANHLSKIFSDELEIDFGTVNSEGKGVIDFAFENESLVMLKLLEIRAPKLFTAALKDRFKILQEIIDRLQSAGIGLDYRIVTSFTIL